jgi:uridylate kinase
MHNVVANIIQKLNQQNLTISSCEFFSGGIIAATLSKNNSQFQGGLVLNQTSMSTFFDVASLNKLDSINENNRIAIMACKKFKTDLAICTSKLTDDTKIIISICIIDKVYHKEITINPNEYEQAKIDICYHSLVELDKLLKD